MGRCEFYLYGTLGFEGEAKKNRPKSSFPFFSPSFISRMFLSTYYVPDPGGSVMPIVF